MGNKPCSSVGTHHTRESFEDARKRGVSTQAKVPSQGGVKKKEHEKQSNERIEPRSQPISITLGGKDLKKGDSKKRFSPRKGFLPSPKKAKPLESEDMLMAPKPIITPQNSSPGKQSRLPIIKSPLARNQRSKSPRSPRKKQRNIEEPQDALDKAIKIVQAEENEFSYLAKLTCFDEETIRSLHKTFLRISGSQVDDGVIDCDEFAQAIGMKEGSLLVNRLFHKFDVTRTNTLNFREFSQAVSILSDKAPTADKIRFSYDLYDLNKDDKIEFHELKSLVLAALEESGVHLSEQTVDMVCRNTVKKTDADQNGAIEFVEYKILCEEHPRLLFPFTIRVDELIKSSKEIEKKSKLRGALKREVGPKEKKERKGLTHYVGKLQGSGKVKVINEISELEL